MLNQYEVTPFIAAKMPQIKPSLTHAGLSLTAWQSIQVLTDYTKQKALEHDFRAVEKCMALVEKLYDKGNTFVRNGIENIFIYSFSTMMSRCNVVEWRIIQSYMPSELYTLYVQQVLKSKC